jgi:hypothetical protein
MPDELDRFNVWFRELVDGLVAIRLPIWFIGGA